MLDEALMDLDFISKSDIYKPLLKNYAFNFTIEAFFKLYIYFIR